MWPLSRFSAAIRVSFREGQNQTLMEQDEREETVLMECCGSSHPFDSCHVSMTWRPEEIRCFIIGENPGSPGKPYFYDPIPSYGRDQVEVRRRLLPALVAAKLINSPTREAFRESGFFFDHAIRCQLGQQVVRVEGYLAKRYQSSLARRATHLQPWIEVASKVWMIGYVALAAVTHLYHREIGWLDAIPSTGQELNSKFFVSPYFTRFMKDDVVTAITERFKTFLQR